jgi:NAD(P)H-dependent flavin oxidoreductase YrpB (nitropropane dioxygenase family)
MWDAAGRPASGLRPGEGEVIGNMNTPWTDFQWHRYEVGMMVSSFDGDPEEAPMWAGLSVDTVNDVKPAGDIVRELATDAEAALR